MTGPDRYAWLDRILRSAARGVERLGPDTWRLALSARGPRIALSVCEDWLTLSAPRTRAPRTGVSDGATVALLEANPALEQGARFVLDAEMAVHARVDVALHHEARGDADRFADHLPVRARSAVDAIVHATRASLATLRRHAAALEARPGDTRSPGSDANVRRPDAVAAAMLALPERGWRLHGAGTPLPRVDLDTDSGAVRQAVLETRGASVRIRWDVGADLPADPDPESRAALAALFLRTAAALPLARPAAAGAFLGFEITLPAPVEPIHLEAALGSLSLAARAAADEAEALSASPALVQAYRAALGVAAPGSLSPLAAFRQRTRPDAWLPSGKA